VGLYFRELRLHGERGLLTDFQRFYLRLQTLDAIPDEWNRSVGFSVKLGILISIFGLRILRIQRNCYFGKRWIEQVDDGQSFRTLGGSLRLSVQKISVKFEVAGLQISFQVASKVFLQTFFLLQYHRNLAPFGLCTF